MAFNTEVRGLVEARFGQGPLLLPMVTRLFVLEKLQESKGERGAGCWGLRGLSGMLGSGGCGGGS